jgi:SAM-dependent methyltransferase
MDATAPNAQQVTFWNEQAGPIWVARQTALDHMIATFGERAMEALAPRPGERIVDVGCGCGSTSLALARRVGASGSVLGVDVSEPMLARARERAAADRAANVRFVAGDAQTHPFAAGSADAVFSRFGVMFFVDPTAAFANVRTVLQPDGRLAFVCWREAAANAWIMTLLMALASVVTLPAPPAPGAPGPFSFGDENRVRSILDGAGFHDVALEPFEPEIVIGGGGTIDEAVDFALDLGPTAAALREAGPEAQPKVTAALREAMGSFLTPRGVVLGSSAWIVTARR